MKETKIRKETLLGDILGVETKNGVEIMFQDKETNICRPVCTVFYDACDGIRKIALSVNKKKGILAPDDGYSNMATIFDEDDLRDCWVPVDVDKPDDGQKVQVTYHGADGGIFCDRFGFYDSKTGNWTLEGLDRFLYVDAWRKIGRPYYKKN